MTSSTEGHLISSTQGSALRNPSTRIVPKALAAIALTALLGACMSNGLQARPVCIKPHGGANVQLAPTDHCEIGAPGYAWVNRQDQTVAGK